MGNASLDIDQYRHIYTEYAPMLMRFAEKFVSGFFAEDIVHDVFLKLWDKQVFRLPENDLKRVLYVSVRNACLSPPHEYGAGDHRSSRPSVKIGRA